MLMDTPTMRDVERREQPSVSARRMATRRWMGSRFIMTLCFLGNAFCRPVGECVALRIIDAMRSALYAEIVALTTSDSGESSMNGNDSENQERATVQEAGAKGGNARAKNMTAEQRRDAARRAALERWSGVVPRATHGDPDHPLKIGDIEIPCYVLENGTRVITNRGIQRGLGMAQSGGAQRMVNMVGVFESKGIDAKDLTSRIETPIEFRLPGVGSRAFGYEATVLADMCDVILAARKAGHLQKQQEHIAEQAEILARGFMRVGIIALVDEATGYQEIRDRQALQAILDKFLRKEFAAWAKRFPDQFYKEIFRLRGWKWLGMKVNRPQCVANYTKDLVYTRLAPGILEELETRNPKNESGQRGAKHHQWLTEDVGHPALAQHLYAIVGLMRIADSWDHLMKMVNRAYPKRGHSIQLSLFDHED